MNEIFYHTGVFVWAVIGLFTVVWIISYCAILFKNFVAPSLKNLKFYIFGVNKEFKGKCYSIWIKNYSHRYVLQRHFHSMKNFKRLAYKRFVSEILKERKEK